MNYRERALITCRIWRTPNLPRFPFSKTNTGNKTQRNFRFRQLPERVIKNQEIQIWRHFKHQESDSIFSFKVLGEVAPNWKGRNFLLEVRRILRHLPRIFRRLVRIMVAI